MRECVVRGDVTRHKFGGVSDDCINFDSHHLRDQALLGARPQRGTISELQILTYQDILSTSKAQLDVQVPSRAKFVTPVTGDCRSDCIDLNRTGPGNRVIFCESSFAVRGEGTLTER